MSKSVQPARVSFFEVTFFQNWYFKTFLTYFYSETGKQVMNTKGTGLNNANS